MSTVLNYWNKHVSYNNPGYTTTQGKRAEAQRRQIKKLVEAAHRRREKVTKHREECRGEKTVVSSRYNYEVCYKVMVDVIRIGGDLDAIYSEWFNYLKHPVV